MKYLLNLSTAILFLAASICLVPSCTDSTTDDVVESLEFNDGESSDALAMSRRGSGCFELVFPITMNFPNGTAVTFDSKEDMRAALKIWKEANPDAETRPMIAFPIEVTQDDEVISVADAEALKELKEGCKDGRRGNGKKRRTLRLLSKCYDLVYPVSIVFPNGTEATFQDGASLKNALKAWHRNAPRAQSHPQFVYPLQVTDQDGDVIDVADADQLSDLRKDCLIDRFVDRACFSLVFPITLELPDGTQISGNSNEELRNALQAYIDENGQPDGKPSLVFPVTVTYEDGSEATAADREELKTLKEACSTEE